MAMSNQLRTLATGKKISSYVLETNDSHPLATGQKSPATYWKQRIVTLKVSLNVMTMIKPPVQVNNHHAGMINILGILNNIAQTGSVSALAG